MSLMKVEDQVPGLETRRLTLRGASDTKSEEEHEDGEVQGTSTQPTGDSAAVKQEVHAGAENAIAAQAALSSQATSAAPKPFTHPFHDLWRIRDVRLPRNLDTSSLRADYMEILKKIRSIACCRCTGKDRKCLEASPFRPTWKCAACYKANASGCRWQLLCQEYGLGTYPRCTRRISRQMLSPNVRG
ncbi:hypothetical protein K466DRAFT_570695 [Polyporus arcularius HHB13444]|uniref:Uncharacterized protein n=1 Tax=Polyporus arcularius HHB13444 TaxID=1314778 RepID=A0A5C3NYY4_9APHY|nr:hypothetical protein K466DRAFT_570695 [Polyporus arcularius HHB13444]